MFCRLQMTLDISYDSKTNSYVHLENKLFASRLRNLLNRDISFFFFLHFNTAIGIKEKISVSIIGPIIILRQMLP